MTGAEIIPFPSHGVKDSEEADARAVAEYLDSGRYEDTGTEEYEPDDDYLPGTFQPDDDDDDDEWYVTEADMFTEADGSWVWLPHEEDPTGDVPVGMVSYTVATRCRWAHRHAADDLRAPQTCCYSVLVTTARLPGPARTPRHWLAEVDDDG